MRKPKAQPKPRKQAPVCSCHYCASHTDTTPARCRIVGAYYYGWMGQVYGPFPSEMAAAGDQLSRTTRELAQLPQAA